MVLKFLKSAFTSTASLLGSKIRKLLGKEINEETLDNLYQILYEADFGTQTIEELIDIIKQAHRKNSHLQVDDMISLIKDHLVSLLSQKSNTLRLSQEEGIPTVILVIGVNGNGKTTSCAKLAYYFVNQGKKLLLGACDTFRAAAVEQLTLWSTKVPCDIVKAQIGSDPAAVAFDGMQASIARHADVFLVDTAGRLHTKTHLMQELEKIMRVLKKHSAQVPHEILLVVDATTGQNAIEQAKIFNNYTPITGLILTKIDGTAKGGSVVAIQREVGCPVKFLGTGEGIKDLRNFDPQSFIDELFA